MNLEGECITNLESAITRPDDFMKPEDDDKVVFFHNGCVQHEQGNGRNSAGEIAASQDEVNKSDENGELCVYELKQTKIWSL